MSGSLAGGASMGLDASSDDRPAGRLALVTGAGSGIGRAVAIALARPRTTVIVVGRRPAQLRVTAAAIEAFGGTAQTVTADLADDQSIADLVRTAASTGGGRLGILVHCAASHLTASVDDTTAADLDAILQVNLRSPFELTRSALPLLRAARGDIVFMNSSAARSAPASNAAYAASKAGLRAFADSLRAEVNRDGIRVLSVFPGRTATAMQAAIFETEGKSYRPELLLQPEDIAAAVIAALDLPRTAELTDLHVRPAIKSP